jgi:hypothetical protein
VQREMIPFRGLGVCVVLKGMAAVAVLCVAIAAAAQSLVQSQSGFTNHGLHVGGLTGLGRTGALVGLAGVLACGFFEEPSVLRRWLLYVYAGAFVVSSFALLMHCFGVSGASGSWL